jgi:peptide/nickel transport system permease protein
MPQPEDLAVPEAVLHGTLGDSNVSAAIEAEEAPEEERRRRRWKRPKGLRLIATIWLVIIVVTCALAPLLPLPDPEKGSGGIAVTPRMGAILGTDQLGRDMLSRILWGGRTSCFIAATTTILAALLGMTLGIIAGYFKGKVDWVIAGIADVVLAFPALIMLIVVTSIFGLSVRNLILGLFVLGTPAFIRIARAHALVVSQKEYVLAARGSGASHWRIMYRHITPSVVAPIAAYALTYAAVVFVAEGSLSFLGLGVPPPTPAWGSMIAAGRSWFDRALHVVLVPAFCLVMTVLSLNYLGDRTGGVES